MWNVNKIGALDRIVQIFTIANFVNQNPKSITVYRSNIPNDRFDLLCARIKAEKCFTVSSCRKSFVKFSSKFRPA